MNRRVESRLRLRGIVTGALVAFALTACEQEPVPLAPEDASARSMSTQSAVTLDPALDLSGTLPREVVVTYQPGSTSSNALASAIQGLGAGVVTFRHLPMVAALATPDQIRSIQALDGVRSIYANQELQYHLAESRESIGVDRVHDDLGYTGRGIGVAILDSGIDGVWATDVAYPDRTVQNVKYMAAAEDIYSTDDGVPYVGFELFIEAVPNTDTSMGHGTHVAGIAAGNGANSSGGIYTGVAPESNLVGISAGETLFIFWTLAGFDYILEHRDDYNIQVVNNSWGTSGTFDPDNPVNVATKILHDAGVTVVFSAGNCGTGDPTGIECPTPDQNQVNPYSAAPWVISVAAGCKTFDRDPTDSASYCEDGRDNLLADFSSRGLAGDPLHHPDITAPGVYIVSTRASTGTIMNGLDLPNDLTRCNVSFQHAEYYTCASGTSMSAPHVAGVVALMEEASGGSISPDEVLNVLTKTATRMDGYAEFEVGAGYMDAYRAVRKARTR